MIIFLIVLGLFGSAGIFARFFLQRKKMFLVLDTHEATVANEILRGIESNVDLKEIEKEAINQNVAPEVFISATEKAQKAFSEEKNIIIDPQKLFTKNTVFLLVSAGIFAILFFLLLVKFFGGSTENPQKTAEKTETQEMIRVKVRKDETAKNAEQKKTIELDTNLSLQSAISDGFLMEIDMVFTDSKKSGTVVGGLISQGVIKMNDRVFALDQNKNKIFDSEVKEIFVEDRSGGKKYFQMAQNGQNVSILLKNKLTNEETQEAPYYLVEASAGN